MTKNEWLDPARRWQYFGGGGIVTASLLGIAHGAVVATGLAPTAAHALFAVEGVVLFVASLFLAFGSNGTNGIVGASRARVAVVIVGVGQLLVLVPIGGGAATLVLLWTIYLVSGVCLIVAIAVVARAGIAVERARRVAVWSVLVSVALAIVASIVQQVTGISRAQESGIYGIAAAAMLGWVGVTYWRNTGHHAAEVPATSENLAE